MGRQDSFTLNSSHTESTYSIHVTLPNNYSSSEVYETIYTLDGNWYFDHVSEESFRISEQKSKQNEIVVGINHADRRMIDYAPTPTNEGEGGAANFTRFINEELIPYIEEHFQADTTRKSRAILGHSAGGLYAAYLFTNQNDLFANYFMLSPAIWYDDGVLLQYERDNRSKNELSEQTVFISKAELEPTQLFMNIFHDRLEMYDQISLGFYTVKGKQHASSAKPAITEALKFYYSLKEK